jgi:hypothetical protein
MLVRGIQFPGVRSMKKIALMFFLLQTTLLLAAAGSPNPADFPVKVHVVFSRFVTSAGYQQVEAVQPGLSGARRLPGARLDEDTRSEEPEHLRHLQRLRLSDGRRENSDVPGDGDGAVRISRATAAATTCAFRHDATSYSAASANAAAGTNAVTAPRHARWFESGCFAVTSKER